MKTILICFLIIILMGLYSCNHGGSNFVVEGPVKTTIAGDVKTPERINFSGPVEANYSGDVHSPKRLTFTGEVDKVEFTNANTTPAQKAAPGSVITDLKETPDTNRIVTFKVTGRGAAPERALTKGQGRILAGRAAIADGYRQFVEKLSGVCIDAYTAAGLGNLDSDQVRLTVKSMLRGVDIKEIVHDEYGIANASMELRVKFTKDQMVWWPEGLGKEVVASKTNGVY